MSFLSLKAVAFQIRKKSDLKFLYFVIRNKSNSEKYLKKMYTFFIDLRKSQYQRIYTGKSYPKRYAQLYAMGYKDEAYFIFHCCIPDILDKLPLRSF